MMKLKSLIAAILCAALVTGPALAQTGQLAPGQVWGNAGAVRAPASPTDPKLLGLVPYFSVLKYGAKGNGSTDDTVAINNAVAAALSAGGGTVYFPASSACYITSNQITIDLSALTTRFQGKIHLVGDGQSRSCIQNTTFTGIFIKYTGNLPALESDFIVRDLRITGNNQAGSIGLQINKAAFAKLENVAIELLDLGFDATDVDQSLFVNDQIRFNNGGMRFNLSGGITSPNSLAFVGTTVANNTTYGIQATSPNSFSYFGGSIQYNGTIACGSVPANCYGVHLADAGNGYGTVLFSGMVFEGNGGTADLWSSQSSTKVNISLDNVAFSRTVNGPVGYAINQIKIDGSAADANYKITNSNFYGYGSYAALAGRPAIANSNSNAKVEIDGLTKFWSNVEAPALSSIYTGYAGSRTGCEIFAGATSGAVNVCAQSVAGTPNITFGTASGTPVVTASSPFSINTTTGNLSATTTGSGSTLVLNNAPTLLGTTTISGDVTGSANSVANFYVATSGNNGNDCRTVGTPCLTLQVAWNKMAMENNGTGGATLNIADGTYTGGLVISGAWAGAGPLSVVGNCATPANVIISVTSANAIQVRNAYVGVSCMELRTTTAGDGLFAFEGGEITFTTMRFGTTAGSQITGTAGGRVIGFGNYSIVGNAVSHLHAYGRGYVSLVGLTATLVGTPAFSGYFAGVSAADIGLGAVTFSGPATGSRFLVHDFGRVDTGGIGCNSLPGNAAGSFDTWGQCDGVFAGSGALSGGIATNSVLTLQSTTNGAPSGDSVSITGSAINLTGATAVTGTLGVSGLTTISGNAASVLTESGGLLKVAAADNASATVQIDTFGTSGVQFSSLFFRQAAGTAASRSQTQSGAILGLFGAKGYTNSGAYTQPSGQLRFTATENQTSTAQGQKVGIITTPNGTTAAAVTAEFFSSGGTGLGGATDPGAGHLGVAGHILASGANGSVPAISSCGTSPSVSGSDNFGTVTAGSGALSSCVINFGKTWGAAPRCTFSSTTAIASQTVTTSTTQLTIGGTSLTSAVINWVCGSTASIELPANDNMPSHMMRKFA